MEPEITFFVFVCFSKHIQSRLIYCYNYSRKTYHDTVWCYPFPVFKSSNWNRKFSLNITVIGWTWMKMKWAFQTKTYALALCNFHFIFQEQRTPRRTYIICLTMYITNGWIEEILVIPGDHETVLNSTEFNDILQRND